jgi:hypothetical protein
MRNLPRLLAAVSGLVLLSLSVGVWAQQQSLKAIIPWDGEGRVFRIGTDTMLFLGAFKGIIYVETSEGKLNEGFVRCPATQKLDLKSQTTSGSGHCMITASEGDTVYADWTCRGKLGGGGCNGDFILTGGSGKFKGITGASKLIVRTPLNVLAEGMASGSVLRIASGLAILPDLKYEIPAGQ